MQSSQSKVQSEDPRDFNAKVNNLYVGENKQEFASRERFHGLPSLVRHALSSEDKKKGRATTKQHHKEDDKNLSLSIVFNY